ncbi:MAG: hypothetical protein HC913_10295 [Microscillaceae bacterium]|nr:hypothetical protein [Microscillaceae bacterium]
MEKRGRIFFWSFLMFFLGACTLDSDTSQDPEREVLSKELPPEMKKKVIEKETVKILEKREARNEKGDT